MNIVKEMEKFGITKEILLKSLKEKKSNHATATYYLLQSM